MCKEGLAVFYHSVISIVTIEKPKRHVRKASHCGSKQQQRSCDEITLVVTIWKYSQLFTRFSSIVRGHLPRSRHRDHYIIACLRHILYIWVLFYALIPCMANRTFNATLTQRLQHYILFSILFPILIAPKKTCQMWQFLLNIVYLLQNPPT